MEMSCSSPLCFDLLGPPKEGCILWLQAGDRWGRLIHGDCHYFHCCDTYTGEVHVPSGSTCLKFPLPLFWWCCSVTQSCLTLWLQGLCSPWNSPDQNTGVGSPSLLQGIFPTQGSNPGLPHCRWILYQLSQLLELAQTHVHWVGDASNHLIPCCPLLLLPSIFPSIRVFSNESALHIRWPKYWSFSLSISPYNEYSGLISFRID